MKIFNRLLTAVVAISALAACNPNKPQVFSEKDSFASFDKTSMTVSEAAGTIRIPVTVASISPIKTAVTYSIVKEGTTAKEGKNFALVDKGAVLNFDGTERTKYVEVKIIDIPKLFTGDCVFIVQLDNATGINLGDSKKCIVTIADEDHPLGELFGKYNAVANTVDNDGPWNTAEIAKHFVNKEKTESSENSVMIYNIGPFIAKVGGWPEHDNGFVANVKFKQDGDKKTIVGLEIQVGQAMAIKDGKKKDIIIGAFDGSNVNVESGVISATWDPGTKVLTFTDGIFVGGEDGYFDRILPGAVWTKQ